MTNQISTPKMQVVPVGVYLEPWGCPYLPLGMVLAYARVYNGGALNDYFELQRLWSGDLKAAKSLADTFAGKPPAIFLLSSYVWCHQEVDQFAQTIKAISPDSIVIAGGPNIPSFEGVCERFLEDNAHYDILVRGEGEITLSCLLEQLSAQDYLENRLLEFHGITGITFREGAIGGGGQVIREVDRGRSKTIDMFPSPFLTGEFSEIMGTVVNQANIESNRGCPYGCTYCDWGSATLQKINKFDLNRVMEEIEYAGQHEMESIFICDSNFGIFERDIEITRKLVECRNKYGFPRKFYTNYAKNPTPKLAEIVRILREGKLMVIGIIALQTVDSTTLDVVKRSNIKVDKFEKLIDIFNAEKLPMASDIMLGLPGQTIESFKNDLQYCFDRKIAAQTYLTSLMPNAPMAEESYVKKYDIIAASDGHVCSTYSFTKEELGTMKELYMVYQFFIRLGVLRYYLYFIQLEHGIKALEFAHHWLIAAKESADVYPISHRIQEEMLKLDPLREGFMLLKWDSRAEFLFQDMTSFYREISRMTEDLFDVSGLDSAELDTVFAAQEAVMPKLGKPLNHSVTLEHDMLEYVNQIKAYTKIDPKPEGFQSLSQFPSPRELSVRMRPNRAKTLAFTKGDNHKDEWELISALRFHQVN